MSQNLQSAAQTALPAAAAITMTAITTTAITDTEAPAITADLMTEDRRAPDIITVHLQDRHHSHRLRHQAAAIRRTAQAADIIVKKKIKLLTASASAVSSIF